VAVAATIVLSDSRSSTYVSSRGAYCLLHAAMSSEKRSLVQVIAIAVVAQLLTSHATHVIAAV
jgi:hypothetical protein